MTGADPQIPRLNDDHAGNSRTYEDEQRLMDPRRRPLTLRWLGAEILISCPESDHPVQIVSQLASPFKTLCWSDLDPRRVTAGSQIPGTRRLYEDTEGHEGMAIRV